MNDLIRTTNRTEKSIRVAVVGAGVAGLTAAHYLARLTDWEITVFEGNDRIGGHAHTHNLTDSEGKRFAVDTGFIVFNDRNYPNFRHLLASLEVDAHDTEMSFSVSLPTHGRRGGFEYNGGSLPGLFAQRRNLLSPGFWKLLREIVRFNKRALRKPLSTERPDRRRMARAVRIRWTDGRSLSAADGGRHLVGVAQTHPRLSGAVSVSLHGQPRLIEPR